MKRLICIPQPPSFCCIQLSGWFTAFRIPLVCTCPKWWVWSVPSVWWLLLWSSVSLSYSSIIYQQIDRFDIPLRIYVLSGIIPTQDWFSCNPNGLSQIIAEALLSSLEYPLVNLLLSIAIYCTADYGSVDLIYAFGPSSFRLDFLAVNSSLSVLWGFCFVFLCWLYSTISRTICQSVSGTNRKLSVYSQSTLQFWQQYPYLRYV